MNMLFNDPSVSTVIKDERYQGDDWWWRCEVRHWAAHDEDGDYKYGGSSVELIPCYVLKHTPRGVWVRPWGKHSVCGKEFVRGTAGKQFAVPTPELAWRDMIIRKGYEVYGHIARLRSAQDDYADLYYVGVKLGYVPTRPAVEVLHEKFKVVPDFLKPS